MYLDLSWIFSIFKVPKISRAVSGSDVRNFRLRGNHFRHLWNLRAPCYYDRNVKSRCDATFSIPNLKTEALASTSASIVNAGLNKIWRTKSKAPSRPPEPGSQVPSVPLQKDNEKQPELPCPKASQHGHILQPKSAPIFAHLPFLQTGPERVPYIPADPQHPSRSLLFLPPTPLPKRRIIFNPEEDNVTLPPAPEPKRNPSQFGPTYPVRSPDHEFPINTLPGPSLTTDYTVPCSPLRPFPTQSSNTYSLSPLPIALSFYPLAAPPPPELVIKIAGPEGYLNADHHKSQINTHFLLPRATEVANSLIVIWQLSHIDTNGRKGLMSLKSLFAQLDETVLDSGRTALSRFSKLSITIPDQVKDVAPCNDLPQPVKEDDSIDLANAVDLVEFAWHGDFAIFASKFKNLSFVTLTRLDISSNISIEDAITLLHSCSSLQTVSLGTIRSEEDSDAIMSMKSSGGVKRKALPNLTYLALESDVALHPLIRRFCWTAQVSLSLTLRKQGTASFLDQACGSCSQAFCS